jgi:hypothetical protein
MRTLKCERCGRFFEVESPIDMPMYCPECEDYVEWQAEEGE